MLTVLFSVLLGGVVGAALFFAGVFGCGWSLFFGILAFGIAQGVAGWMLQRRVKAAMTSVQEILLAGQKQLQAKVSRWQMRPPGSIQAAQTEMARDQRRFVDEAIAASDGLHRFDNWVPLMKRQIATAQLQLHWMVKDFKEVDALMPKALVLDPTMLAIKMARLQMTDAPVATLAKLYAKGIRRLRYNQNVLLAALYSWILVQRKDVDGAFKVLTEALKKSDNPVLKANHEHLANNRVAHFSNAGLGDQWYALLLEEPRIRQQRQVNGWAR